MSIANGPLSTNEIGIMIRMPVMKLSRFHPVADHYKSTVPGYALKKAFSRVGARELA